MSKSTTVNKNRFTLFADGRCQTLLESTRRVLHSLPMVDVKVYYSQRKAVYTLANGRCQSRLQSTRMGLHPLLMVDVKSTRNIENGFTPFIMGKSVCSFS